MSSLPNHLRSDFGLPIYVLFDPGQVTSLSGPQYSHLQNGDKTAHALLRGVRYAVLPRAVLSTRVSVSACSFTAITPNTVLPRSHSTSLSCTVVKTDSEPRRQAPEPRLGPQSSREAGDGAMAGQQAALGWGRGGAARPPPLARPGRVSCRRLRLHPAMRPSHGLAPGPCRCNIRTSCASQMFLVYPQMCVASSPARSCPGLTVPTMGWGLALGPSEGGGTFLWAVEFVSCFA